MEKIMVEDKVVGLADCLSPEDICLDLQVAGTAELFDAVGRHMERVRGIPADLVARSLARRERIGSTGLGYGVAIPHARLSELDRPRGLYARLRAPIPFRAPDDKPVLDFLILLVPAPATDEHLVLLAEASQKFVGRQFRDRIRACASRVEAYRLLCGR
jgi:PTS system nitrogen regulatory IIA component